VHSERQAGYDPSKQRASDMKAYKYSSVLRYVGKFDVTLAYIVIIYCTSTRVV
jgi:hypothetical protein